MKNLPKATNSLSYRGTSHKLNNCQKLLVDNRLEKLLLSKLLKGMFYRQIHHQLQRT